MRTEISTPHILHQLRGMILHHLENYPQAGVMGLARKSRVSHMSIRRILKDELKSLPSPNTVLNLVSAVSKESDFKKVIARHTGVVGEFLRASFPHFGDLGDGHRYEPEVESLLWDREGFLVFVLCSTRSGSTRAELTRLLGALGEERLEQLIDNGVITEGAEGRLKCTSENYCVSVETGKRHAGSLLSFVKPALMPQGKNLFYFMVESVNDAGRDEIVRIQSEAVRKIRKVLQDGNFSGEQPIFSMIAADTLSIAEKETT